MPIQGYTSEQVKFMCKNAEENLKIIHNGKAILLKGTWRVVTNENNHTLFLIDFKYCLGQNKWSSQRTHCFNVNDLI